MATIRRYDNFYSCQYKVIREVIIEVDGEIAGAIEQTPDNSFLLRTKGRIPALEGIRGASFDEVWSRIAERVRAGGVQLTKVITDVDGMRSAD